VLNRAPHCCQCRALLSGPKLVIEGRWLCPDCAYERDHGPADRVQPPRGRTAPQAEQLFPPDDEAAAR
jgi:hypothetical protein